MSKYSVIIPTYNRAYCLKRAIDSVIAQTLSPQEIIIIDDGSSDNTKETVGNYKNSIKNKDIEIIYHYQENKGVSSARNLGIQISSTKWLALLDSDDAWLPNKIQLQFERLNQINAKICHTEEIWYRNNVRVNPMKKHAKKGGWIYQHCLSLCAISPSSALIHKEIFNSVGYFDEKLPACEDYDLWLRITAKFPVAFVETPLTLKYGGHEDQLSQKYWGMDRFRIIALEKILNSNSLTQQDLLATLAMLEKKIRVYIKGAEKRNKTDEVEKYEGILKHYIFQDS